MNNFERGAIVDTWKKRLGAAVLSTTLVFGVAACDSSDNPDNVEEEVEDEVQEEIERGEEAEDIIEEEVEEELEEGS